MIEQELTTIVSTIKNMPISFSLIGQKENERKQLLTQLQSIERSQGTASQPSPIFVYTTYQPRQSLYKDLSIPLASPFLSTPSRQNL